MPTINYIEKLYKLEDGSVKDLEIFGDSYIIHIQFARKEHICLYCGSKTNKIKDYRQQKVKLDSINNIRVYAVVNKRRYVCPHYGKTFYETSHIVAKYQRRSQEQFFHIIQECSKKQSFKDIALRYGVSITTVLRYFARISYSAPKHLSSILSMDEFKGNAQGQKYQVALNDPVLRKPLDILPKRATEELITYFHKNFSYQQRCKVNLLVTDLSTIFKKVITESFPKAKIITDRYHVLRLINWAMERVRKRVQNTFGKERIYFKRSKYLMNKNLENLKEDDLIKLETMLAKSKDLGYAYMLKEAFKRVLQTNSLCLRQVLNDWLDLVKSFGLPEFKSILTTFTT